MNEGGEWYCKNEGLGNREGIGSEGKCVLSPTINFSCTTSYPLQHMHKCIQLHHLQPNSSCKNILIASQIVEKESSSSLCLPDGHLRL